LSDLRSLLIRHEGLRLKPYLDSKGKITIGVGRNIEDRGITVQEALYLLENDIAWARTEAKNAFPWFGDLSDVRQDVVLSMVFNLGTPRLSGFKRMLAALAKGDYSLAANEMLVSQWAEQVGHRAVELAAMMKTGQYQS
jgi:lysozyme